MEYPVSPATLVCPVCLKKLPTEKESAEYHVNGCVDMCAKLSSRPTLKQKQSTLRAFLGITEAKVSIKVREEGKLSQLPFDKQLPAHKRILGTPFVVDAFNYGSIDDCQFYFLSHFHSDHYQGLKKNFNRGMIICSETTGNLVVTMLGVDEQFVRRLSLHNWTAIGDSEVFLLDAFHCPGSVLFIIRTLNEDGTFRYILHTGDFRGSRELLNDPAWKVLQIPKYDAIYLDTTYCDPQYDFPQQSDTIAYCSEQVAQIIKNDSRCTFAPIKRLILVGSYLIGKEKVALAIAKLLDTKIYCSSRKRMVFECLQWAELTERITTEPSEALVHIVGMSELDPVNIGSILDSFWPRYTHALAIRPTGWTFSASSSTNRNGIIYHSHTRRDASGQIVKRKDTIAIMALSYSEHSSFQELCDFLDAPWIKYDRVIPTVNNPKNCYLQRDDYQSGRDLLLAWYSRRKRG